MIEKLKTPKSISWSDEADSCIQRHKIITDTISKINELVDAVNELQKRVDPPSVYDVMREKDAIIARHIGEKNQLREALETAKWYLMQIGHLNMAEHGLGSDRMMIDWCKSVALDGVKKIKPILEQKEEVDE